MRIVIATFAALAISGDAAYAQSPENSLAVTECPSVSPNDGRTPLLALRLLDSDGVDFGAAPPDKREQRGRRIYTLEDYSGFAYRNTSLQCVYGTSREGPVARILLSIPGSLLRCESEELPPTSVNALPDPGDRFWCTSRIEAPAR